MHRSLFEVLRSQDSGAAFTSILLENFRSNRIICRYPASQLYRPDYDSVDDAVGTLQIGLAPGMLGGRGCAVLDCIAGREQADWCLRAASTERLQNVNAIVSRQHPIENYEVERLGVELKKTLFTGLRYGGIVAFATQAAADGIGRFWLVFDDQNLRHAGGLSSIWHATASAQF